MSTDAQLNAGLDEFSSRERAAFNQEEDPMLDVVEHADSPTQRGMDEEQQVIAEHKAGKDGLREQRCRLEFDVIRLRKQLQDELDLRLAYKSAATDATAVLQTLPSHLPAYKSFLEVAVLEFAVSKLEEQVASLQWQLITERSQHENNASCQLENEESGNGVLEADAATCTVAGNKQDACSEPASPDNVLRGHREHVFMSSSSSTELPSSFTDCRSADQFGEERGTSDSVCVSLHKEPIATEGKKDDAAISFDHCDEDATRELWRRPNKLSERMIQCMMDIYQHVSDHRLKPRMDPPSPLSTLEEPSELGAPLLPFARSPLVDLRRGSNNLFDPYSLREKLPWREAGPYNRAIEVCWMSVGRAQLEYAAEALHNFKSLVEQLLKVDPSAMTHSEKLAFWINVYNALMMHGFLAYGTPKNESKYYSLMEKASYTIGGKSINALTIEYVFLKGRPHSRRHQHKPPGKVDDRLKQFAISRPEPLVSFALSFGAWSCPAVRVYTAGAIHTQLEQSLISYLQASVGISSKGKLLIPRLLHSYARDATSSTGSSVPEWICQRLASGQQDLARVLMKRRPNHLHHHHQHHHQHHHHHHHHHSRAAAAVSSRLNLGSYGQGFAVVPFDARFRYLFLLPDWS